VFSVLICFVIIRHAIDDYADIVVPWTLMGLPADFTAGANCSWAGAHRSQFILTYSDEDKGSWKLDPRSGDGWRFSAQGFGKCPFSDRDHFELCWEDQFGHGSMMKLRFTDNGDPSSDVGHYRRRTSTGTVFFFF
jgi:hypothetical protein